MKTNIKLISISIVLIALTQFTNAADLLVQWTMPTNNIDGSPLTDLAGAKIYYGTSSSNYTQVIDVGLTNSCIVTGLTAGVTYFINGTAFNTAGLESDFCQEVPKKAATKPAGIGGLTVNVNMTVNLSFGSAQPETQ